jgi:uncharacterized membrane-anchored protein
MRFRGVLSINSMGIDRSYSLLATEGLELTIHDDAKISLAMNSKRPQIMINQSQIVMTRGLSQTKTGYIG